MGLKFKNYISLNKGYIRFFGLIVLKKIFATKRLRKIYHAHVLRLVNKTELFNGSFYLEENGDVAFKGFDPLFHYVAHGDREGRKPMPFFDPVYYRAHVKGLFKGGDSLLHYVYIGRYIGISPSSWFDVQFYLDKNKDVMRAGFEPLLHFVKYGGLEGRSPCAMFDGSYYLRSNRDVQDARINPLAHYLQYGRFEGRSIHPVDIAADSNVGNVQTPSAILPSEEEWVEVSIQPLTVESLVDVIVPVYKGMAETLRCLHSALISNNKTPFELVVINDCSPDDDLVRELKRLSDQGFFSLLHNEVNRGFVQTVNRGMRLHAERDVILLNADAEVYNNWLDRFIDIANNNEKVATITPLSNNATICSYPRFIQDNPYPLEIGYNNLDLMADKVNDGFLVDAPTGVGFCMYIRRAALNEVGLFDEEAFDKGYGEENDFCQRAIAEGWRNVIAPNVFARHWGSTSFMGETSKRVSTAMKIMDKRYPNYQGDVRDFIENDPLSESRKRLDWERLQQHVKHENVLIVCHNRGGGSERHVQEDSRSLLKDGVGVFYLRPQHGQPSHCYISHPICKTLLNLEPIHLGNVEVLKEVLSGLNITRIHTHGLVDFEPDAPQKIQALKESLDVPLWVDIHDYKVICPRINLADKNGFYCGEPGDDACNSCLSSEGNDFGVKDIHKWRKMHYQILSVADNIFVPDSDVSNRLASYFNDIEFTVSPHEEFKDVVYKPIFPKLKYNEPLKVVVIGAISLLKGYKVLLNAARMAKKDRLPIEYILLGYSMNDEELMAAGVKITGRYLEEEVLSKIDGISPHVVWLPSIWPETYSYTLSIALKANKTVFAFDIGAISRRLNELDEVDNLLPLNSYKDPVFLNRSFTKFRDQLIC